MKKTINLLTVLIAAFIVFEGCKKKDYNNSTTAINTHDATKLKALFTSLKPTPQNFTVTAGTYRTITASGGTKLAFYPNSFKDASGNIITSGTVDLQVTEAYKPGAMIASRAVPVSTDGRQLISGGEVNIKATMNGQEVYANKYGTSFKQPASSTQPMELFIGSTGGDSITTWTQSTSSSGNTSGTSLDTFGASSAYYIFDSCEQFNWLNCDHFYSCGCTLTDVSFDIADTNFNANNTAVFVIFPSINSVGNAYSSGTSSYDFVYSNVPVGNTVDIVCISAIGSNYYYSHQTGVTVTSGMVIHPVMTTQSLSYIAAAIAAL